MSMLHSFKSIRVILPGQSLHIPVKCAEGELVAIEPWEQNKNPDCASIECSSFAAVYIQLRPHDPFHFRSPY